MEELARLKASVDQSIDAAGTANLEELKFEVEMFLAKLQLLREKEAGELTIDRKRVKENLFEFLRDDLVYFLQKLLSEHRVTFEKMMPGMVPSHREIIFQLKEMQARVFYPVGKDFSKTSMVGRWFLALHARGMLGAHNVMHYFDVYKNRLYSLIDDKPFDFSDLDTIVRRMLQSPKEISFDEIYNAEIELRREITFTLLRRLSTQSRLEYLVSKEIIEELSDNFIRVLHRETSDRLRRALAEMDELNRRMLEERKTVDSEIRIAARTQDKNLQKELPTGDPRIQFALWYDPLMSVGGDFYTVRRISDNEYSVFLADISGHGLGAAMFFNTVRLAFEENQGHADRPEKTMRMLNEALYGKLSDNFVTAIYIYVNLKKKILKYANGGHPKAFLIQKTKDKVQARFLRQTGRMLGLFEKVRFREGQVHLGETGRLVAYTDGITEAEGERGGMLGERGLLGIVRSSLTRGPEQAIEDIHSQVVDYQGAGHREDDRSVLLADFFLD